MLSTILEHDPAPIVPKKKLSEVTQEPINWALIKTKVATESPFPTYKEITNISISGVYSWNVG